jgi:hypothetical protein
MDLFKSARIGSASRFTLMSSGLFVISAALFITCGKSGGSKNSPTPPNGQVSPGKQESSVKSQPVITLESFSNVPDGFVATLKSNDSNSAMTFECILNNQTPEPCQHTTKIPLSKVLPGQNTLVVKGKLDTVTTEPLKHVFFYTPQNPQDISGSLPVTPPVAVATPVETSDTKITISHDPVGRSLSFTNHLTATGLQNECKFGDAPWKGCSSPVLYDTLDVPLESTSFTVRAVKGSEEVYATKPFSLDIKPNDLDYVLVSTGIDDVNKGNWQGQKTFQMGQVGQSGQGFPGGNQQQGVDLGLDIVGKYPWQLLQELSFTLFNPNPGNLSSGGDLLSVTLVNAQGQLVKLADRRIFEGVTEISYSESSWSHSFPSSYLLSDIVGVLIQVNGPNAQLLNAKAKINRGTKKIRTLPNVVVSQGSLLPLAGLSQNGQIHSQFLNQALLNMELEARVVPGAPIPLASVEWQTKTVGAGGQPLKVTQVDTDYRETALRIEKRLLTELYDVTFFARQAFQIASITSKLKGPRLVKVSPISASHFSLGGRNYPSEKSFAFNVGSTQLGGILGSDGALNSKYCDSKLIEIVVKGKKVIADSNQSEQPLYMRVSLPQGFGQLPQAQTQHWSAYINKVHFPFLDAKLSCQNPENASVGQIQISTGAFEVQELYAVIELP